MNDFAGASHIIASIVHGIFLLLIIIPSLHNIFVSSTNFFINSFGSVGFFVP